MSYNGWRNYETWNLALWLDNSYYNEIMSIVEDCKMEGMSKAGAAEELYHFINNLVDETIEHYAGEIGGWLGDYIMHYNDDLDIDAIVDGFLGDYDDRAVSRNAKPKAKPRAKPKKGARR